MEKGILDRKWRESSISELLIFASYQIVHP
jgi:hypothetical protein